MVKRLNLGELTPTIMTLQMLDRSMAQPEGIMEDVLIKVGKFIFPVDFVVIDIEEDKQVPLLLGRPFLATGVALIDVRKGELTLRVGNEEVHFNVRMLEKVVTISCELIDDCKNQDSMNENMMNFQYSKDLDTEYLNVNFELKETILILNEDNTEKSSSSEEKAQEVEKSYEGLIMKELPNHLKYVFFGDERSKPIIIVADLIEDK